MPRDNDKIIGFVPRDAADDTFAAVELLRAQIKSGEIIGAAWVVLKTGGRWEVDVVGHAKVDPVFTSGCVRRLLIELDKIIDQAD